MKKIKSVYTDCHTFFPRDDRKACTCTSRTPKLDYFKVCAPSIQNICECFRLWNAGTNFAILKLLPNLAISPGVGGGELPYKNDGSARRTF